MADLRRFLMEGKIFILFRFKRYYQEISNIFYHVLLHQGDGMVIAS
jgi:hypothetical protein